MMPSALRPLLISCLALTLAAVAGCQSSTRLALSDDPASNPYLKSPNDLITAAGATLHMRVDGPVDAPVVIFLHGFGASLHTWDGWTNGLATDFRVIRFDLPGAGLSPPDPTGQYTDDRAIELIEALMARHDLESAAFIGHSLGGRIAVAFAVHAPRRVERLVLVAPDGYASPFFQYGQRPRIPLLARLAPYVLPRAFVMVMVRHAYGPRSRPDPATLDRYYDLIMRPGARQALLDRMSQTLLVDPATLLPQLHQPVLLVWGQRDRIIPVETAADYLQALPHADLVEFDDLGHLPHEEAPALTLGPIQSFLTP